jgi:hypothetical protein
MSEVTEEKRDGVQRIIKVVAETLTIIGIGSYIIGFLIVNSHLLSFGYTPHSLFKTTYLSAGVLFLVLTTPIVLAIYIAHRMFLETKQGEEHKIHFSNLLFVLLFLFYSLTVLFGTSDMQQDYDGATWKPLVILGMMIVLIAATFILRFLDLDKNKKYTAALGCITTLDSVVTRYEMM